MSKFTHGDRIKFYGLAYEVGHGKYVASKDVCEFIRFDENYQELPLRLVNPISNREYLVHPKQCRRIVKKEKKLDEMTLDEAITANAKKKKIRYRQAIYEAGPGHYYASQKMFAGVSDFENEFSAMTFIQFIEPGIEVESDE